ncbi:MAG: hypothetical protein WCI71_11150 [Bacteroidota bacterium]
MKKFIVVSLSLFFLVMSVAQAQNDSTKTKRSNYIRSGFYFKLGPVFPLGQYAQKQTVPVNSNVKSTKDLPYLPAQIGATLDMGYLIYIGPSFANNHLRAGIDLTFLNAWFNSTIPTDGSNRWKHYYYNVGQKIGPLITINPVDRLMIDLSYKINANLGIYYGEWDDFTASQFSNYGIDFFHQEISMGIRYRALVLSLQYNFGTISYDNLNKNRIDQTINADTFRLLFGVKF